MFEHNPLLDGRLEGSDRFGAWRINADLMSYEVKIVGSSFQALTLRKVKLINRCNLGTGGIK